MKHAARHAAAAMVAMALLAGLAAPDALNAASIKDFGEVRVDGPFTHKNLSIYVLFVRTEVGKRPDYITLTEGLRNGWVVISEAHDARVGRLLVTNKSDRRLFLQVGQVLGGGKQDRTLQTSFVVPANTRDVPIPSFCVEQTRWSGPKGFDSGGVIVPGRVRAAIQAGSQDRVWSEVRGYKRSAQSAIASRSGGPQAPSRTSSVHEELSDARFKRIYNEYQAALSGTIHRYTHPVGFVYAVNGQISTVDVYQASALFKKLWPELLRGAAAEAAPQQSRARHSPPDLRTVANFIAAGWEGSVRTETLGVGNVYMRITGTNSRTGRLSFNSEVVHAQIVRKATGPILIPPRPIPIPRPPRPPRPIPMPQPPRR